MTDVFSVTPVEQVYTLLGLTESNGGISLVPVEDIQRAIDLFPQNIKYAASNVATQLATKAAAANDPSQFSLQGVMSVGFRDPSAYWRHMASWLLEQADIEYNRDRRPDRMTISELKNRHQVEPEGEYAPARYRGLRR